MSDAPKAPAVAVEWSHGRARVTPRRPSDGGAPALPPSVLSGPTRDAKTGRFLPGNREYRRRVVRAHAAQLASLDPRTCGPWLRPHVEDGARYAVELAARFPDPALARLVMGVASAHATYLALLGLAAAGDGEALREARGWLREHRSALVTLTALSGTPTAGRAHTSELARLRERVKDGGGT